MSSQLDDKKTRSFELQRKAAPKPSAGSELKSAQTQPQADTQSAQPEAHARQANDTQKTQETVEQQKKKEEAVLRSYTKIQRSVARLCLVLFILVLLAGLFCLLTANTRGLIAVLFCLIVVPCVFYGFKLYVDYTVRRRK